MKMLPLLSLELRRLLQSRLTWLVAGLTALSPALGLVLYQPASAETMLSMYLANPAIAGGAAGGVLFGLLSVFELDRTARSRVEALTDAAVSPLVMALVRLLALLAGALLTLGLTMLLWLPVSRGLIGSVFDGTDYVLAYLLFLGLALPLGILSAASAYQLTRRLDLSLVLFAVFAGLSLTVWADDWQLCWLNPCVWALSDDFSNFRIFRSVAYMRLTWLAALAGVWTLSWLCVRQNGRGLFRSSAPCLRMQPSRWWIGAIRMRRRRNSTSFLMRRESSAPAARHRYFRIPPQALSKAGPLTSFAIPQAGSSASPLA